MDKQKKALADLAVNITANISVIGAGLALYEKMGMPYSRDTFRASGWNNRMEVK